MSFEVEGCHEVHSLIPEILFGWFISKGKKIVVLIGNVQSCEITF